MTIKELKQRKQELHYTNEQIAEKSGVPLGTVQKIFSGATRYPRLETVEAIERALYPANFTVNEPVAEYGSFNYDRQGSYTVDDYRALPDWPRHELIDGELIVMEAPTTSHQRVLGRLFLLFSQLAADHPECEVFIAPVDVQLDRDNKTNVQPDVMIICDEEKVTERNIFGAPDLVVEITSPSSVQRDSFVKLKKYKNAGVREYWLINLQTRVVVTYLFGDPDQCGIYGFDSVVPVGICNGAAVDFKKVTKGL